MTNGTHIKSGFYRILFLLFTFILLFICVLTSLTRFKHDLQTEFKELSSLFHSLVENIFVAISLNSCNFVTFCTCIYVYVLQFAIVVFFVTAIEGRF